MKNLGNETDFQYAPATNSPIVSVDQFEVNKALWSSMDELAVFDPAFVDTASRPQWRIAVNIDSLEGIGNQSDRLDWEQWVERDESFVLPMPVCDAKFPIDPEILVQESALQAHLRQAIRDGLPGADVEPRPFLACAIPSRSRQSPTKQDQVPGEPLPHSTSGNRVNRQRDQGRSRISNEAKTTLLAWLEEHRLNPYPDQNEMRDLSTATDLPLNTVTTWFANARRRYLPKLLPPVFQDNDLVMDGAENSLTSSGGAPANCQNSMGRIFNNRSALSERLSPSMIGYLSTPMEEESVPIDAIESAATIVAPQHQSSWSTQESPNENYYDSVSISNESSRSSVGSAFSSSSFISQSFSDRRKGRRLTRKRGFTKRDVRFQCTFCTIGFSDKHAWKRHEESQHVPQETWICMPSGPRNGQESELSCLFCDSANVSNQHLVSQHNAIACHRKPIRERTFARRDNLKQHLRQVHKSALEAATLQSWRRPIIYDCVWECGFCHEEFDRWPSRVEHVAKHFNEGLDLEVWLLLGLTRQLSLAAAAGDWRTVQSLLQQTGVDPNGCPGDSSLPLLSAARYGHETVVSLLLKHDGCKPIAKQQCDQALSLALEHGHKAIARMLEHAFVDQPSADPCLKSHKLEAAVRWPEHIEQTSKDVLGTHHEGESSDWLCLDYEPDPLSKPLFLLVKEGKMEELQMLFERHEVDVNVKNELNETPLSIAASNGELEMTRLLLQQNGIEKDARDFLGHTALYHAASAEHEAVVRLLLQHGAHPEKDEFGSRTPLELARRNRKT